MMNSAEDDDGNLLKFNFMSNDVNGAKRFVKPLKRANYIAIEKKVNDGEIIERRNQFDSPRLRIN